MDNTTVFSKTGKGLLEVKNRSNRITKEQYRVLSLVDGKANLDDLADRARMNATGLRQILTQLSDGGYIKVLVSSSANDTGLSAGANTGSYYVDDLDFTAVLGPGAPTRPSVYQSAETERRQRESAERKAAEAAATRRREEEERRRQAEAQARAQEELAARKLREDAERKSQLEVQRLAKLEAELKARLELDRKAKQEAAAKRQAEAEAKLRADLDRQLQEAAAQRKQQEEARLRKEAEEQARRAEEERRRKAEEERKRKEAEEQARRAEEERRRKVEEERKRKEAEEQVRRAEEDRKRKEEEERKRKEAEEQARRAEEERKRKEAEEQARRAEEERKRKEEEERKRKEAEEQARRAEEERKRKAEEECKRREAEEQARRAEEERKRKEEEERKRKEAEEQARRAEEERKRKAEEERKRTEAEEQARRAEEERKRNEEEERKRKEAEEQAHRAEDDRRKQEREERKRREEEERARLDEVQRLQFEEMAERTRLEDEVRRRKAERDRRRRGQSNANSAAEEDSFGADLINPANAEDRWLMAELASDGSADPETRTPSKPEPAFDATIGKESRYAPLVQDSSAIAFAQGTIHEDPEFAEAARVPLVRELDISESQPEVIEVVVHDLPEIHEDLPTGRIVEQASVLNLAGAASVGVTEESIRKALEEQERRLRMEEETRAAIERAELEAQIKAEQDAREMAEASEKLRKETELRAREESERLLREEKERRELEEEERRKQRETERRVREHARQEAERRKREEDLAKQRKEQEERELRKAERDRIHKDLRRVQVTPLRIVTSAVAVLVLLGVVFLQFASLSAWAPDVERLASQRLGEPVHIQSLHAHLFPRLEIILDDVTVGASQDVKVRTVQVVPQLGSLFSANKLVDQLELKGMSFTPDTLVRARDWLKGPQTKPDLIDVRNISMKDVTLNLPAVNLPTVEARIRLGRGGEFISASVATADDHLSVDLSPRDSEIDVTIKGRTVTMPIGPALEVIDVQGKGVISQRELRIAGMEYFLYGGQGKADITVRWTDGWSLESNFDLQRVALEAAMRALKIQVVSDGALDAAGLMRLQSPQFATLFDHPQIDANFTVRRGNLAGFDIPRALQQRYRDGVQGGKTRFEELTGNLSAKDGRFQYRGVKLSAGVLKANGQVDIAPDGSVSGKLSAELRASAGTVRGGFNVSGNDQATVLKP